MELDTTTIRAYLKEAKLKPLFIEELGWNIHKGATLRVAVSSDTYQLVPIAEKRGVQIFECPPDAGGAMPDRPTRQKIEREVTKSAREHLIVFTNAHRTVQLWQWVAREPGRPAALREQRYTRHQSGDALIQKLQRIAIPLDEEEAMSLIGVTQKLKDAFDKDRVTKKFYEFFKAEHAKFLKLIDGIDDVGDRQWYASLMLNRLMFVYFIQKKGFLDGDPDYLKNRLTRMQQKRKDKFHTFYRHFLLRLFHEGLGHQPPRPSELDELLGNVPYLNGGLFDVHELETANAAIEIPDAAFEALFAFFDAYEWHLDDRPLRTGKEINPDVLGHIFEKYVNQKQMGAYYTKEDITEYIAKNTVIPYLFDAAEKDCAIAFEKSSALWLLLCDDPDRYIYPAVRKGVEESLPGSVAAGIDDVSQRTGWNRPADSEFALPTETWREHIARRQRCLDLRAMQRSGEVTSINDLITHNLDIRQFAQDVIEESESPELVWAFFNAIRGITVLDPAVGSGAFLFAALNILKPLYDACLDRMQAFIDDLKEADEEDPRRYSDFRDTLARVAEHPNREYYILKSIIITNLYGVDIMEEAVEICKLRLFLKLVAQLDSAEEIEPLPDMDFNIRAGNTLVGFTSLDAVRKAMTATATGQSRMISSEQQAELAQIEKDASFADRAFQEFHRMQRDPTIDEESFAAGKAKVREWLDYLRDSLDRHLAREYGVEANSDDLFERWRATHRPFHWIVEFYGIMSSGGFSVIIGNPPYVMISPKSVSYELKAAGFQTYSTKNLYPLFYERSLQLAEETASLGLIVQLTALSSAKMPPMQNMLLDRGLLVAPAFPRRPESIFDGVEMPVTILISRPQAGAMRTSRISRFYTEERPYALSILRLQPHAKRLHGYRIGKLGSPVEVEILQKLEAANGTLDSITTAASDHILYYQEACRYWAKACKGYPFFRRNGERMVPPHGRVISLAGARACAFAVCLANSSLFYWYYSAFSDCEHINDLLIRSFRIPSGWEREDWSTYESRLAGSLMENAKRKVIRTKQGHTIEYEELDASKSKPIIDEIDRVLAGQYGLTQEELDFIINYDFKYRMGADTEDDGDA